MIEIIKEGIVNDPNRSYKMTCPNCGTEFSFDTTEVHNSSVRCPICKRPITVTESYFSNNDNLCDEVFME